MKPVRLGAVLIPPMTALILGTLLLCFIVSGVLVNFVPGAAAVVKALPVTTDGVLSGEVWRLLTYAFVHSLNDPFHVLFNGLMIYFFGRELEDRWGPKRYLLFALLTVLAGGIFVVVSGMLMPGRGMAMGASAFALGVIVAWGLVFRDREARLYFAIPARGIHMVWFAAGIWLLEAVSTSETSAAAHLGGMLMAAFLVLGAWRPNAMKLAWSQLLERLGLKKKQKLYVVPKPSDQKWVN